MVQEGMGKRIVPFRADVPAQIRVNLERMWANFMVTPAGYSKTPQDGYFYNGFDNPNIFFDQVHQNTVQNYRSQFLYLAYELANREDYSKVNQVLDRMNTVFPNNVVEIDYRILYDVCMLYLRSGNKASFDKYSPEVEAKALDAMAKNPTDIKSYWNPYKLLIDIYENRGDNAKALDILYRLDRLAPNTPEIRLKIDSLKARTQFK
jgi:tetratricopeptide (TPR) repeat protein